MKRDKTLDPPKYKKALKGRALKKLFFERDDYRQRHQKLVGRVKLQNSEILDLKGIIKHHESTIANNGLALLIAKARVKELEQWVTLKRPDVLKIADAVNKQQGRESAGLSAPIVLNITQRRRAPRINSL